MINYSVATLCILAVVMVGKAIHSFQEAGIVTQTSLPIPSIAMIGLYNTLETVLTQVFIAVLLFWVFKKMKTS
jgi:high-affinity iron transporter